MKRLWTVLVLALVAGCSLPTTAPRSTLAPAQQQKPRPKAKAPPALPPMPKGMLAKAATSIVLATNIATAAAAPSGIPPMSIAPFGDLMLVRAEQWTTNELIMLSGDTLPTLAQPVATYACSMQTQFVAAGVPAGFPMHFVRAHNMPCGFAPAAADKETDLKRTVKFPDGEFHVFELPRQGKTPRFILRPVKK